MRLGPSGVLHVLIHAQLHMYARRCMQIVETWFIALVITVAMADLHTPEEHAARWVLAHTLHYIYMYYITVTMTDLHAPEEHAALGVLAHAQLKRSLPDVPVAVAVFDEPVGG